MMTLIAECFMSWWICDVDVVSVNSDDKHLLDNEFLGFLEMIEHV